MNYIYSIQGITALAAIILLLAILGGCVSYTARATGEVIEAMDNAGYKDMNIEVKTKRVRIRAGGNR